jgi:hypothetical protein
MTKARDLANASTALSAVSATELAFVDGVTSAIQTQMDAKAPSSTAVTLTGTQTLTNKTLTSPALTTPTISTATTNGDILYGTGSGALARLGIGTTGQVLNVASGVPAWATVSGAPDFLAGKNKIINGDFYINQRGFSSTTTNSAYGFDRWTYYYEGGTVTYSAQNFTAGTAPVAGYEGKSFMRLATTGQSASGNSTRAIQKIEDVRTFAGQTVTVSFWAKASSGTPYVGVNFIQDFGTGGSPSGAAEGLGSAVTISTSWARYSVSRTVASISGKTIGTTTPGSLNLGLWTSAGSAFASALPGFSALQNVDIDIWGVQVEAGSTATPFTTATGTLQGELSACQRYYYQIGPGSAYASFGVGGFHDSTTAFMFVINTPVVMRTVPTFTTLGSFQTNGTGITLTGLGFNTTYPNVASYNGQASCSGATTGYGSTIRNINDTTAKMMFSSEL